MAVGGVEAENARLRRLMAGALALSIALVVGAFILKLLGPEPSAATRTIAAGCIPAGAVGGFAAYWIARVRRKRAVSAALQGDAPVAIPAVKRRMLLFSLVLVLVAAAFLVAIADPAVSPAGSIVASIGALVTAPIGLAGFVIAGSRGAALRIGRADIACAAAWQGAIPWSSLRDARLLKFVTTGDVYVVLTLEPAAAWPLAPLSRPIAASLELDSDERPINPASFGVAPDALLVRIQRGIGTRAAEPGRPARPTSVGQDPVEMALKHDGLTSQQRANLALSCFAFAPIFLAIDLALWKWVWKTPSFDRHAAIIWVTVVAIGAAALLTWLLLVLVQRRQRAGRG